MIRQRKTYKDWEKLLKKGVDGYSDESVANTYIVAMGSLPHTSEQGYPGVLDEENQDADN